MKVVPGYLALAVLALGSISDRTCAQDDSIEARAKQMSDNLIRQHEAWRTMSSPGASVQAKAAGREGNIFFYNFYVTGLPTDQLYTVVAWPVTSEKPFVQMEGVSLGKDGLVSCTGRQEGECEDPDSSNDHPGMVDFAMKPVKGEPYRFALINGDSKASIIIVPDPITAKDKGCTLDVVRLSPNFELAFVTGTGYPPNSEISFNIDSYSEKHPVKTKSDTEGKIHFAMMPFVAGPACSPSLKFDWGQP